VLVPAGRIVRVEQFAANRDEQTASSPGASHGYVCYHIRSSPLIFADRFATLPCYRLSAFSAACIAHDWVEFYVVTQEKSCVELDAAPRPHNALSTLGFVFQ